jgi:hypothetical protein
MLFARSIPSVATFIIGPSLLFSFQLIEFYHSASDRGREKEGWVHSIR